MLPGDSKEMNKTIKQLWDNSIEEFSKEHQYATIMLPEPLREKFAELIVQECIGVVEGGRFLHDQAPTAIFARECSGAIKRHFGVEL